MGQIDGNSEVRFRTNVNTFPHTDAQACPSVCPPFWTCPYGLNLAAAAAAARFGVTFEPANNELRRPRKKREIEGGIE